MYRQLNVASLTNDEKTTYLGKNCRGGAVVKSEKEVVRRSDKPNSGASSANAKNSNLAKNTSGGHHLTSAHYSREVQQARQRKGWTQKELSQKSQILMNDIQRFEQGSFQPVTPQILAKLNKALGLSLLMSKIAVDDD